MYVSGLTNSLLHLFDENLKHDKRGKYAAWIAAEPVSDLPAGIFN